MQKYQPPHERRKNTQKPNEVEISGQGVKSGSGSTAYSRARDTDNISTSSTTQIGYGNRNQSNGTGIPGQEYRNGQSYPSRYDQRGAGSSRIPPSSSSTPSRFANTRNNQTTTQYAPRISKKDWSTPSSTSSVLASPAGDIKPMRNRGNVGKSNLSNGIGQAGVNKDNEDEFDFELIQSVSRSGGDGAQGDALKNWEIQDRYRLFIEKKIEKHNNTFKTTYHKPPTKGSTEEIESLCSIVLLFRKLREGVVASSRIDDFAIEVFGSSARYSILANNKLQLISSLSGLVPGLYQAVDNLKGKGKSKAASQNISQSTDLDLLKEDFDQLSIKGDKRKEFVSLFLLYQLVILGEQEFWSSYFELTSPRRKNLRRPFDEVPPFNAGDEISNPSHLGILPFISPSELRLPISIAQSVSTHNFDPIRYFKLVQSASAYERVILSWGEDKVQERAWDVLKKAYLSTGIEWAGRFVGKNGDEVIRWVGGEGRGGKVESGIVKLR